MNFTIGRDDTDVLAPAVGIVACAKSTIPDSGLESRAAALPSLSSFLEESTLAAGSWIRLFGSVSCLIASGFVGVLHDSAALFLLSTLSCSDKVVLPGSLLRDTRGAGVTNTPWCLADREGGVRLFSIVVSPPLRFWKLSIHSANSWSVMLTSNFSIS